MTGRRWDVVVVGSGPAGSAAALAALAAGGSPRVLLVDRAVFPRDKACGDGIAPHAVDVVEALGVAGITEGYAPVRRLHLGRADGAGVTGDMARPAHVVPREVLDARLAGAAVAAGADTLTATVRGVRVEPDGVVVDTGDAPLRAGVVVAADGANSAVRRSLGLARNPPGHVAVAIRGYAPVRGDLTAEQRIVFGAGQWPAYAWSFPIGDGRANVGYGEVVRRGGGLSRAGLLARLEALLPGSTAGGGRWRGHHLPLSSRRPRQPPGRVLLAGDAASLVNPMTGEGIYYAVLSGSLAGAAAVAAADPGRRYRADLQRELGVHLRHTAVAARLAAVPGIVEAGVATASRQRRVFDDLVELGLGRGRLTRAVVTGLARGLVA